MPYEYICGQSLYDKPSNLRCNIFSLRDKMLDVVKKRYGDWYWGYPNKQERERLARERELGADPIYIASTKEECMLRFD
jgi:hypothetical protein